MAKNFLFYCLILTCVAFQLIIATKQQRESCPNIEDPLVSIVLTSANKGKYFEHTITSIIDQTYQNWELIIVDDGSYDQVTLDVLEKYPIVDKRIKVIKLNSTYGIPPYARNSFYIFDDDDLIHPEKTEMQLRFLQKYQEFDAVTSGYYLIDQNDQPIGFSPYHEGVDIEVLKLRGLWIHTMQQNSADDAVLTRHLMLNHDFNVYFTENRYLAFYRKFQRKQDQLTNQFVDLRNYQNDENYCGYDLLYKYENSSINRDDMSYIYQIQSDKETMATSIWKFLKSLFVKGEEEYEDLKWLSSYMIYGHVNNQLGYEVDPRKLMLQHYTFMFTDLISLQFDSTIPSKYIIQFLLVELLINTLFILLLFYIHKKIFIESLKQPIQTQDVHQQASFLKIVEQESQSN